MSDLPPHLTAKLRVKAHKMVRSNTYVESGIYHDLVQQARGLEIAAETLRARAAAERGQG